MASGIEAVGSRREGSDKELKRTLQKLAPSCAVLGYYYGKNLRSIVRTLNVKTVTTCTRLNVKKHSVVRTLNESRHEKTCLWVFATRYDSNRPAQRHKLARVLKFRITTKGVICILSRQQTAKTLSDTVYAQANMHPHCSHMA